MGVSVRGITVCGQADACENITLPQTSFVGGNCVNTSSNAKCCMAQAIVGQCKMLLVDRCT